LIPVALRAPAPGSYAGYLLTGTQVLRRLTDGAFELSRDGDFKVNEASDLKPAQGFASIRDLVDRIL